MVDLENLNHHFKIQFCSKQKYSHIYYTKHLFFLLYCFTKMCMCIIISSNVFLHKKTPKFVWLWLCSADLLWLIGSLHHIKNS